MITKSKKGFTIIEVVLVLAIAGLIFLMVFIALPNMQRSQRDTQRRNDYSALSANITQYVTNNNGKLPTGTLSPQDYLNAEGTDPDGIPYQLSAVACQGSTNGAACSNANSFKLTKPDRTTGSKVFVVTHAICKDGGVVYSKSSRAFAIYGALETGSGSYCQSNS